MFINNKYTKYYNIIIEKCQLQCRTKDTNEYYESHHIIPTACGGSNNADNRVLLTAREHFLCHWLLTKMFDNPKHKRDMHYAFGMFTTRKQMLTSKQFELARKAKTKVSSTRLGSKHTEETKEKIRLKRKDQIMTDESNAKRSDTLKDRVFSEEHRRKLSEAALCRPQQIRQPHSEETRLKISKSHLGKSNIACKGKPRSEETKRKISETLRRNKLINSS